MGPIWVLCKCTFFTRLRSVKWTDDTEQNETDTIQIGEDFEFIQESVLMGQKKAQYW
jgi:hypothetical protein